MSATSRRPSARTADGVLGDVITRHSLLAPDRPAIEDGQGEVTYGQLQWCAEREARELLAAGLLPGQLVAVVGGPTAATIAGMFAVLKAGCAFVPVDPQAPGPYRDHVMAVAAPAAVLVDRRSAGNASAGGYALADPRDETAPARSLVSPLPDVSAGDLAYVLFTSGSTGQPRGVMVEHASIMNYLGWFDRTYAIAGRHPPSPVMARLTQDAALQDVLGPLSRGDCVWLPDPECRRDPRALLSALRARPGCALHVVPTVWAEVIRLCLDHGEEAPDLAALFLGGDIVPPRLWDQTRTLLPRCLLANVYGPTEATVQVTGGYLDDSAQRAHGRLSVGHPVDGVQLEIRDERGAVAAAGIPGEIYIRGIAVARGYLGGNQDDSFQSGEKGDRVFRTGDAGCLLEGSLIVLGRLGGFAKIRGNRVDPGEVEAVLIDHPQVAEIAALVVAGAEEQAELAVLVQGELSVAQVRAILAARLPRASVPTRIEVSGEPLPRTWAGKIDRSQIARRLAAALPAGRDDVARPPGDSGTGADVADVSQAVDAIWCATLSIGSPGEGDFFDSGGHSVLAMRFVGRVRKELGVKLSLKEFYDDPRLLSVTSLVRGRYAAAPPRDAGRRPAEASADWPVSIEQATVLRIEQIARGLPLHNVIVPLTCPRELDEGELERMIRTVLLLHPSLRTRFFRAADGQWRQRVDDALAFALESIRAPADATLDQLAGEAERFRARDFALASGGLPFRAAVLRAGDKTEALLLGVHHVACDAASLGLVVDALRRAHDDLDGGREPSAEAWYGSYACWQQSADGAACIAADLEYWRSVLVDAGAWSQGMPTRRREARQPWRKDQALPLRRAGEQAATRSPGGLPGLLAAVSAGLRVVTSGPPVFQVLTQNRRPEFEKTVGLFANAVLLPPPRAHGRDLHYFEHTYRDRLLAALEHQAAPFDLVARMLGDSREGSGAACLRVAMDYLEEDDVMSARGLPFSLIAVPSSAPSLSHQQDTGAPVSVRARVSAGELIVSMEFDAGQFDVEEAGRVADEVAASWRDLTLMHGGR